MEKQLLFLNENNICICLYYVSIKIIQFICFYITYKTHLHESSHLNLTTLRDEQASYERTTYYRTKQVPSPAHSKANLLTPGCGEGKCSVYCRAPSKEFRTARVQKAKLPYGFQESICQLQIGTWHLPLRGLNHEPLQLLTFNTP